jgi:hypothetical protein
MSTIITASKEVYKKKLYLLVTLVIALLLFVFNIAIINYEVYLNFESLKFVSDIFWGTISFLPLHTLIFMTVASLLTGIFTSFLIYHIKSIGKTSYTTGSGGVLLGLFAPACASCGIGLVAVLGLTGVIGALPFGGIEISIAGILLLIIATFTLTKKIVHKTCTPRKK